MDRSRLTLSSLDELRQIRSDIAVCQSLDFVRKTFDRIQEIRQQHLDDFEVQIVLADAQQEVIERARFLRKGTEPSSPNTQTVAEAKATKPSPPGEAVTSVQQVESADEPEGALIPEDVPKLDQKTWKLAVGLAILFTVGAFALFFYMIQTARRLNFVDESVQNTTSAKPAEATAPKSAAVKPAVVEPSVVSPSPTLRLYTDLTAGAAVIDDEPAKDLGDGELDMDQLTAGVHNVKVDSSGGGAAFGFALDGNQDAPRVTKILKATNAMVVLVSVKDGTGRLTTDATGAIVSVDGKPAGQVSDEGILLHDLGTQDHELELSHGGDKQKFVLTYTSAPTLTVFVKSDPSTGVLTVSTGQDGASVFIDDSAYKRLTDHGAVRIPLKVGTYKIRVHLAGFQDPTAIPVVVKKNAEASVQFHLLPALATLQIKGAQPGTVALIDKLPVVTVGSDGTAKVVTVKPGDHIIELQHDQALPKQLPRKFAAGQTVTLSGSDTALDRLAADNKSVIPGAPGPPLIPPPPVPQLLPAAIPAATGEQVHKGGGFIPYHTPKLPGRYYFQAHAKLGGVIKRSKLQWYAGYEDVNNYVLFSLDGKHAEVKQVRDGKQFDIGKIPFDATSDEWVQIEMNVKPDTLQVRAKSGASDWTELTPVTSYTHDFTKASMGMLVPSNDEVAVSNFRFSTN